MAESQNPCSGRGLNRGGWGGSEKRCRPSVRDPTVYTHESVTRGPCNVSIPQLHVGMPIPQYKSTKSTSRSATSTMNIQTPDATPTSSPPSPQKEPSIVQLMLNAKFASFGTQYAKEKGPLLPMLTLSAISSVVGQSCVLYPTVLGVIRLMERENENRGITISLMIFGVLACVTEMLTATIAYCSDFERTNDIDADHVPKQVLLIVMVMMSCCLVWSVLLFISGAFSPIYALLITMSGAVGSFAC